MCTSKQDINDIYNLIRKKSTHTYIEKYVLKPNIDMEKVTLLHHIYNHIHLSTEEKQKYITTVMLIQIALDTHEDVLIQTTTKFEDTVKQLSVLAGDYYSGLYYLYLSELGNIDMIQQLADAIKRINEYKMRVYYKETDSINQLIDMTKEIESLLFTNTASYLQQSMVIPIIEEWLLLNRLIKERHVALDQDETAFINCLKSMPLNNRHQSIVDVIQEEITNSAHKLNELLNDMPIHLIELKGHISNFLMKRVFKAKRRSMVEEG